jgi:hypothetical protein
MERNSNSTGRDYEDFEMIVDWKIEANGAAAFIYAEHRKCKLGQ